MGAEGLRGSPGPRCRGGGPGPWKPLEVGARAGSGLLTCPPVPCQGLWLKGAFSPDPRQLWEGGPEASRCRDGPFPALPQPHPPWRSPRYCHCAFKALGSAQLRASREPWRQASIGLLIRHTDAQSHAQTHKVVHHRPETPACHRTKMPQGDVNKHTNSPPPFTPAAHFSSRAPVGPSAPPPRPGFFQVDSSFRKQPHSPLKQGSHAFPSAQCWHWALAPLFPLLHTFL